MAAIELNTAGSKYWSHNNSKEKEKTMFCNWRRVSREFNIISWFKLNDSHVKTGADEFNRLSYCFFFLRNKWVYLKAIQRMNL